MRCYSKQLSNNYFKLSQFPRNYSHEKRMKELYTFKQSQLRIGKYKYSTDDELGKGFSSKVYKAVEIEKVHKRYAIKIIELKKFRGSNLQMLEAEIDIHKNLEHENVLRLYEVIKTPAFYYLVLQYCPHGTLHEYIRHRKKIPQSTATEIMDQILAGYRYLISQGVIHRDLKPANILRFGNKWKIGDLGFAIRSKYAFKDNMNVGTPLYMAPQSLKKNYYSVKTDIFALGVILFEMVQGRTPWQSSNEKQLLEKMKQKIQLPDTIKDQLVREFIKRSCHIVETKRMSKEEFMNFQFRHSQHQSTKQPELGQSLATALFTEAASVTHSRRHSVLYDPHLEQFYKQNNQAIAHEFLLARHLYSCVKNIDSFMLEGELKKVLNLALFKWLLRLMSLLVDKKANFLNLKCWGEYTNCKFYRELHQKMAYKSQIYEKEYLQLIKYSDIKVIRTVNKKFPDLCHNKHISQQFYASLNAFLVPIIREHNHSLMLLLVAEEQQKQKENIEKMMQLQKAQSQKQQQNLKSSFLFIKQQSQASQFTRIVSKRQSNISNRDESKTQYNVLTKREYNQPKMLLQKVSKQVKTQKLISLESINGKQLILNDKIQALQSLHTIYRISDLRSHPDSKQLAVQKIRVVSNYSESHLTRRDYLDLRRLLRNI